MFQRLNLFTFSAPSNDWILRPSVNWQFDSHCASLTEVSHRLSVVARLWVVLNKQQPIHERGCNPVVSDPGRVHMVRPNRDYTIELATSYQMMLMHHLKARMRVCKLGPYWAVPINQDERSRFDNKTAWIKSDEMCQTRWINQDVIQTTDGMSDSHTLKYVGRYFINDIPCRFSMTVLF